MDSFREEKSGREEKLGERKEKSGEREGIGKNDRYLNKFGSKSFWKEGKEESSLSLLHFFPLLVDSIHFILLVLIPSSFSFIPSSLQKRGRKKIALKLVERRTSQSVVIRKKTG